MRRSRADREAAGAEGVSDCSFRAYVDESGDEGFVFNPDGSGSRRWLVLSAVVVRRKNDHGLVALMADVRKLLGKAPKKQLHFSDMKHEQRVPYVRQIAANPLRTVSVLVHKPSIREPEKFQAEKFLLSGMRHASCWSAFRGFAATSEHSDPMDVRIDWRVVDPERVSAVNHEQLAGLQVADAVASGLYYAVQPSRYGEIEEKYAALLRPTFYRHKNTALGYGVKFWRDHCSDSGAKGLSNGGAFPGRGWRGEGRKRTANESVFAGTGVGDRPWRNPRCRESKLRLGSCLRQLPGDPVQLQSQPKVDEKAAQ